MFLENKANRDKHSGWIEVITGGMFSGKTEELIRRLKRARIAGQKVEVFKPHIDIRYHESDVVSHNETSIGAVTIHSSERLLLLSSNVDVVGIDEAQFFDKELPRVCQQLANQGVRVIAAGLDMDYKGMPFGSIPQLMSIAEYVTKVHAICIRCGDLASFSHRLTANNNLIVLGEKSTYEPLCRKCFNSVKNENNLK
ncbi:MAG: thymidine kinase [Marinilabiliaceae bacterium]|nr:thymidine kinase [Marinilabiliaceae bacterium]